MPREPSGKMPDPPFTCGRELRCRGSRCEQAFWEHALSIPFVCSCSIGWFRLRMARMRTRLRWAGLVLALVVLALWLFRGPNLGWTKNSVPHVEKDPVTEIESTTYVRHWVPGIDFLGGGLAVAAVLAA